MGADAELGVDAALVGAHGALGYEKLLGDLRGVQPRRHKQREHYRGTAEWSRRVARLKKGEPEPSTFSVTIEEPQGLIDTYHGTGEMRVSDAEIPQLRETCTVKGAIIGRRQNGRQGSRTDSFTIHYSKTGVHAVPAKA